MKRFPFLALLEALAELERLELMALPPEKREALEAHLEAIRGLLEL